MKKALAIVLAMALLCIISVGGTLSYFTDTDGDVNTMTVGQVLITQNEQYRVVGGYADWHPENGEDHVPTWYPYIGNHELIDGWYDTTKNAIDKIVTVTVEQGSQPAYIRTVFAFEMKNINGVWENPIDADVILNHNGIVFNNAPIIYRHGATYNTTADGADAAFVIGVYTYVNQYAAGETTAPSLLQVLLNHKVGNEFFDAVQDSYDIMVLSQAVQVAGFEKQGAGVALDTAFGAVDATNAAKWFNEGN